MRRLVALLGLVLLVIAGMWGCSDEKITALQPAGPDSPATVQTGSAGDVVTLETLKAGSPDKVPTLADVAVTQFTATPEILHPGDSLNLQATVANLGAESATGPFDAWIGVLGSTFEFGRATINQITAGGSVSGTVNFTIPVAKFAKAYPPGVYTLYCTHNFNDNNPTNNYLLVNIELKATGTGDIQIETSPAGLDAPWTLTGPYGYVQAGSGALLLPGLESGDYTVTWGHVSGYDTPAPETAALGEGTTLTFTGVYSPTAIGDDVLMLYFDDNQHCTTADFLAHVTAYIVYLNPTLTQTRGFECGFDITSPTATTFNSSVSVTYPTDFVDVGVNDAAAGTYNYVTGFSAPMAISGDFVFGTLDIFYLDMATELDFTLRGAIPSSDTVNGLPMVMLDDFSLMPLSLGMAEGSPTMVLNPTGDCPVILLQ